MVVTNPAPTAHLGNVIAGRYRMIGNFIAMHLEGPHGTWIVSRLTHDPVQCAVTLTFVRAYPSMATAIDAMNELNRSEV